MFNFFRPGYVAPQSAMALQGLVAPEMQITTETSVLGYANFILRALDQGFGQWNSNTTNWDLRFDLSSWDSLVTTPETLVDTLSKRLLGHTLSDDERAQAIAAVSALPINSSNTTTLAKQRRQRIQAAIAVICVTPEFIVQQ
ncbi:MAG: hypothetical protein ACOYNB_02365 [Aquabacterium sp.]|uniref:hypothetical protein n=1 Tax=Aquabacterium sp. TaxID=1872578 RepID=UPI003BDC7791